MAAAGGNMMAAKGGMRVLLLGSGGREHALAWKIAQSPLLAALTVLPGSDGIALLPKTRCISGNAADKTAVLDLAAEIKPDLVVIGPEAPLAAGVSDALRQAGYNVAAPSQAAARLESSKIFSKSFMTSHGIPTADFAIAVSPEDAAQKIAQWDVQGAGIVVKADGLAAGKPPPAASNPTCCCWSKKSRGAKFPPLRFAMARVS